MEPEDKVIRRIVVLGPESTGKSTLCAQLAEHYNSLWCPEYARQFLQNHGMNYSYEDLLTIAKGQVSLEEEYLKNSKNKSPLFIDTDMYVMKVWCEFVFGQCHQWILDQIIKRPYDLYLLCNIDLPWVKDELREYPDHETRARLYNIYEDIMINQSVPWVNIHGGPNERLEIAIVAINSAIY